MKKMLALLLSVMMCLALIACSSDNGSTEGLDDGAQGEDISVSTDKTVVNVGLSADVPSLDPYYGGSVGQLNVMPEIYQSLFDRVDFGGEPYGIIAKEYILSEDQSSITVSLYDYVKDSNGNAITAEDVIFSYETARASGQFERYLGYLDSMEALDDYTVVFYLNGYKLGLDMDILSSVWVVDKDEYHADTFATKAVGTGPYVVTDFISGSSLTLEKNENYWQTDELNVVNYHANVDVINYKIIMEAAQMSIALETGDIDIAETVSFSELTSYFVDADGEAVDGYTVNNVSQNLFNNMAFNMSSDSNVGNDLYLRQAILYAIDNEGLVQGALSGSAKACRTWGADVYGDYLDKWDTEDYYDYNVEKAAECLTKSDYATNGSPTLRIIFENNDTRKAAAEMIQAYLLAIGINSEINAYDAALFSTYRYEYDQWDILLDNQANSAYLAACWSSYLVNGVQTWKDKPVTFNGADDEELTNMVKIAASEEGHTAENIDAVHQYIKDNAYVYGLWAAQKYQVAQEGVTSIVLDSKLYLKPGACVYAADYKSKS